jgi:hypothetical protein
MKAAAARCERDGDPARAAGIGYGPVAEPELRPDAAARARGDLQAGQRMLHRRPAPGEADAMWWSTERTADLRTPEP